MPRNWGRASGHLTYCKWLIFMINTDWIDRRNKSTVLVAVGVALQAVPKLSVASAIVSAVSVVIGLISAIACVIIGLVFSTKSIDKSALDGVSS